jgi:hypothetical protein
MHTHTHIHAPCLFPLQLLLTVESRPFKFSFLEWEALFQAQVERRVIASAHWERMHEVLSVPYGVPYHKKNLAGVVGNLAGNVGSLAVNVGHNIQHAIQVRRQPRGCMEAGRQAGRRAYNRAWKLEALSAVQLVPWPGNDRLTSRLPFSTQAVPGSELITDTLGLGLDVLKMGGEFGLDALKLGAGTLRAGALLPAQGIKKVMQKLKEQRKTRDH